jgi:hypothetical protein
LNRDDILAMREYMLRGAYDRKITARIGIPRKTSDGRYECVAEVDEGDVVSSKPMNGVDAFEAIQLALMLIGAELNYIKEHSTNSLTWLDGTRTDLGLPTYPDFSLRDVMKSA